MLKVGVTGGIGSGKSVICQVFATLGIPVFKADDAAKYLMNNDTGLIAAIKELLGQSVYTNGQLDNEAVRSTIFTNPEKLQQLNSLVHPATITYAAQWMLAQNTPYAIKEAAIFFESGSNKGIDIMIGVSCPLETRIDRVVKRSSLSQEKVLDIISKQMDEEDKMKLCDYVITNDDNHAVLPQVLALHEIISGKAKSINA